jgi:hypothetical protein
MKNLVAIVDITCDRCWTGEYVEMIITVTDSTGGMWSTSFEETPVMAQYADLLANVRGTDILVDVTGWLDVEAATNARLEEIAAEAEMEYQIF